MGNIKKKEKPIFAQNVMKRRKALRLSSIQFAEKAGIPYPTFRDIQAGISRGTEETKSRIAKALGCQVYELEIPPETTSAKTELQPMEYRQLASLHVALAEKYEELEAELEQLRVELENFKNIPDDVKEKLLKVSDWNKVRISLDLPFVESGTAKKKAN